MSDITEIEAPEAEGAEPFEPEGSAEAAEAAESTEPSAAAKAIAELSIARMTLQELKKTSPADLVAFAERLEIENANSMRKQDMMFAILKTLAEEGVEIGGSGTLEVVQDGFGFFGGGGFGIVVLH